MKKIEDFNSLRETVNAMQTHAIGCMISGVIDSIGNNETVDPELKNVISEMGEFADKLFTYIVKLNYNFNKAFLDFEKGVEVTKDCVQQFIFLEDKGFRFARNNKDDRFLLIPLWLLYFLPDEYNLLKFSLTYSDREVYNLRNNKDEKTIIIDSFRHIERKDIDIESFYIALPNYGIYLSFLK